MVSGPQRSPPRSSSRDYAGQSTTGPRGRLFLGHCSLNGASDHSMNLFRNLSSEALYRYFPTTTSFPFLTCSTNSGADSSHSTMFPCLSLRKAHSPSFFLNPVHSRRFRAFSRALFSHRGRRRWLKGCPGPASVNLSFLLKEHPFLLLEFLDGEVRRFQLRINLSLPVLGAGHVIRFASLGAI